MTVPSNTFTEVSSNSSVVESHTEEHSESHTEESHTETSTTTTTTTTTTDGNETSTAVVGTLYHASILVAVVVGGVMVAL